MIKQEQPYRPSCIVTEGLGKKHFLLNFPALRIWIVEQARETLKKGITLIFEVNDFWGTLENGRVGKCYSYQDVELDVWLSCTMYKR